MAFLQLVYCYNVLTATRKVTETHIHACYTMLHNAIKQHKGHQWDARIRCTCLHNKTWVACANLWLMIVLFFFQTIICKTLFCSYSKSRVYINYVRQTHSIRPLLIKERKTHFYNWMKKSTITFLWDSFHTIYVFN